MTMDPSRLNIVIARSCRARMRGLLGRSSLQVGEGLYLRPCRAIHTCFMKFAIDVRFYNKDGALVKELLNVPPGRWMVWGGWSAHGVLETMAGDRSFEKLTQLPAYVVKEK